MEIETWKNVVGYEDHYEVSSFGQVRRKKSKRLLKSWLTNGYCRIELWKQHTRTHIAIHRVVAQAFIPMPIHPDIQVHHKNHVKTDNRVENLEWLARTSNNREMRIRQWIRILTDLGYKISPPTEIEGEKNIRTNLPTD